MQIKLDRFGGIQPRVHPTLLPDGMATVAHNVRLKRGKLVPLREPKLVGGADVYMERGLDEIANAKSLHVWRDADGSFSFLAFPGVTWLAAGNIADDDNTRVIISGSDADDTVFSPLIYMRDDGDIVRHPLVKTSLSSPLKVQRAEGSPELTDNKRYTRFFWTWVDAYGYESPVSEPSLVYEGTPPAWEPDDLEYMDGDSIRATNDTTKEQLEALGVVKVRIYKVVTGTSEGRIQFIHEVLVSAMAPESTVDFTFTVKDEDAGEILVEIEAPPEDLQCIHKVPGNFYCGFSFSNPKTVMFSDINLLYSWPVAYRYDVADNLVALAVTSNSVFALTNGWPYVLSGTAPESMTITKLAGPAACVSPRGVCVYKNAVYYVSNQGLMTIYNDANAGTVCSNLTEGFYTKDQWLALNPSSCIMGQFDGALHLFFRDAKGNATDGLIIDLLEKAAAMTTHDEAARCLCVDDAADKLYFVREERG